MATSSRGMGSVTEGFSTCQPVVTPRQGFCGLRTQPLSDLTWSYFGAVSGRRNALVEQPNEWLWVALPAWLNMGGFPHTRSIFLSCKISNRRWGDVVLGEVENWPLVGSGYFGAISGAFADRHGGSFSTQNK